MGELILLKNLSEGNAFALLDLFASKIFQVFSSSSISSSNQGLALAHCHISRESPIPAFFPVGLALSFVLVVFIGFLPPRLTSPSSWSHPHWSRSPNRFFPLSGRQSEFVSDYAHRENRCSSFASRSSVEKRGHATFVATFHRLLIKKGR